MIRKNNVRLLVDCSGSTGGQKFYWDRVKQVFTSLGNEYGEKNVIVALWDDKVYYPTLPLFLDWVSRLKGGNGTYPQVFATREHMPENCDAVIITDGQISANDVKKCYEIVNNRSFNSVSVYFVDTGGRMDLTVSAPFTANCKNISIHVQDKTLVSNVNTNVNVDLDKYYNNPELFLQEAPQIRGTILLQNLGKQLNVGLRDCLLALQKNLMGFIAKRAADGSKEGWETLRNILISGDYVNSVKECQKIIPLADSEIGKKIEAAVADLILQCSGNNNFSFDNLDPGRLRRADVVTQVSSEELPPQTVVGTFECPITLETSNVALLIHKDEPVLSGLDNKYLEAIMTNPLLILDNLDIMNKLADRLGHLVGCDSLTPLFKNPVSPFTRRPITSAFIPFFPEDKNDRSQYNKANMFALADLFFGKKLVGDTGLWMGVLYLAISRIGRFTEDKDFMMTLKTFLCNFWKSHVTNITLSGLPIAPMMKAPTDIALWFCVASPDIMNKNNVEDDASNRLRSFGVSSKYLLELVDVLGYSYDKPWTVQRLDIYRAFNWMMTQSKDPNSNWRTIIRAQWQNHYCFPDGTVVLLDGPANKTLPLPDALKGLKLDLILSLMQYVDKTKTANSIMLPRDLPLVNVPPAKTNYGYPDNYPICSVPICPATFRPYVNDTRDKKYWKTRSESIYGPLDKQISNYNYFIQFVFDHSRFPQSKQEFIVWVLEKQKNKEHNPVDTLPKYEMEFVDGLFGDYEAVLGPNFSETSPQEFKKRVWMSMRETERAKLDGSIHM